MTTHTSSLFDLLRIKQLDYDLFCSAGAASTSGWLYGGQVAAQALLAAGQTVAPDRVPHSLHGNFLRSGDDACPTYLRVARDRDGRSFSARRVEATQKGEVLFTMAVSFHRREEGMDRQMDPAPAAGDPDELEPVRLPVLVSMDCRLPAQPYAPGFMPTRYWARCTADLAAVADPTDPADPLLHAAVLTYLSDMSTGLIALHEGPWRQSPTLSHSLWLHRPIRLDDWVLVDLVPRSVAGGRGWYTGTVHTRDGLLGASLAQESLFGRIRREPTTEV